MSTQIKGNKSKKIIQIIIVTMVLVLFLIAILVVYSKEIESYFTYSQGESLADYTQNNANAINQEVANDIQAVEVVAENFTNNNTDEINTQIKLKKVITKTEFSTIYFSDNNGNAVNENGTKINVSGCEYFKRAVLGESTIMTDDEFLEEDDGMLIVSAPVIDGGKVVATIHGFCDIFSLRKIVEMQSFDGESYSMVIDGNGKIIIPSISNKKLIGKDENYFEFLEQMNIKNGTVEDIKQNIYGRKSGNLLYGNNNTVREAYYMPLTVNDWYIVKVITYDQIEGMIRPVKNIIWQMIVILIAIALLESAYVMYSIASFLKKKNEELKTAAHKAESASKAKDQFLSRMSHDMRTPMNGIIGMTGLALEHDNLPEDVKECLDKIDVSSHFLLGLINDVLDMSKIESNALTLNPEPFTQNEFEFEINSLIRPLCDAKNIKFECLAKGAILPAIEVDKKRYCQIIFNLLSNSIKFTPNGGNIWLVFTCLGINANIADIKVSVKDTGSGISKEFQKNMFNAFSQENSEHVYAEQGSGLGLSIVKNLVELMGGTIEVDSDEGKGTTITINMSVKMCNPVEKENKSSFDIKEIREKLNSKNILLCEDNEINAEIAKRILEKAGINVILAGNGKEGLDKFIETGVGDINAVLMDIRMPVMDGIKASRKIRSLNRKDAKSIPIIALTANVFDQDKKDIYDAGMNDILNKPIEPTQIYNMLCKYINK